MNLFCSQTPSGVTGCTTFNIFLPFIDNIHKVGTLFESLYGQKNEQNEKIKWAKIFVQTLINIRTACMEIFDHFIISLFCSFFSIQTLRECTYFMNAPIIRVSICMGFHLSRYIFVNYLRVRDILMSKMTCFKWPFSLMAFHSWHIF